MKSQSEREQAASQITSLLVQVLRIDISKPLGVELSESEKELRCKLLNRINELAAEFGFHLPPYDEPLTTSAPSGLNSGKSGPR